MTELGRKAARGGAITLGGQGARALIQLLGMVVLSRLLPPDVFGLVAMAYVVVALGELLRDMGLSAAAIQAERLSPQMRSNLFWVNAAVGTVLFAACWVTAPLVASLYDSPQVETVLPWLGLLFVFNGLQAQYQVHLARELRYRTLALSDVVAQAIGLAAAIIVAMSSPGPIALVAQYLTAAMVLLVLRAIYCRWLPRLPRRVEGMGKILAYGGHLSASQILNYLAGNADTVVIGARFGASSTGVYSRAFQIVALPINQILNPLTNVLLPTLSRAADAGNARFWRAFVRVQTSIGLIGALIYGLLTGLATPVVAVLLGPAWSASAPILFILAIGGVFRTLGFAQYFAFLALGLTKQLLYYNLVTKTTAVAFVVVGSAWGVTGVAVGYTAALAISWPICLVWLKASATQPFRGSFGVGATVTLLATMTALTSYAVHFAVAWAPVVELILGTLAGTAVFVVCALLIPTTRSEIFKLTSHALGVDLPSYTRKIARGVGRRAASSRIALEATALRARVQVRSHRSFASGRNHLVVATRGAGNIGDDAMLASLLSNVPGPTTVITEGTNALRLPPGLEADRVQVLPLPGLVSGPSKAFPGALKKFLQLLPDSGALTVVGADVMDGGYSRRESVLRAILLETAADAGLNATVLGFSWKASADPVATRFLRRVSTKSTLFSRDPVSVSRLERSRVRATATADSVFALPIGSSVSTNFDDRIHHLQEVHATLAVVNVSGLLSKSSHVRREYARVIEGLVARQIGVIVLPHVIRTGDDDLAAARTVLETIDVATLEHVVLIDELLSPDQVATLCSRVSGVFTGRMHCAILALSQGTPALVLASQGKVEGLMQMFDTHDFTIDPQTDFAESVLTHFDQRIGTGDAAAHVARHLPKVVRLASTQFAEIGVREERFTS